MHPENIETLLELHFKNQNITFSSENKKICGCGREIAFNGITSHRKICDKAEELKNEFLRDKYHIEEYCVICGTDLTDINKNIINHRGRKFIFCSTKCLYEAKHLLKKINEIHINDCIICNNKFETKNIDKKTCSSECYCLLLSNNVADWHKKEKDTINYKKRNEKIGISSSNRMLGNKPWNTGLHGDDFFKHYIDKNGENNFYKALQKNDKWFKKTLPEKMFEEILIEINCRYQYSFFTQNRQFDFIISTDSYCFIVEIDGDYWHKSRRLEFDEEVIKESRALDEIKGKLISNINAKKQFILLRVWEYHIYDKTIFNYFKDLFQEINVSENISKIEEYYKIYY